MIYKTALPLLALLSIAACGHEALPVPPANPDVRTSVVSKDGVPDGLVPVSTVPVNAAIPVAPAGSIEQFGANLHGVFRTRQGNFVYSPASIAMALSMTREGARGETAAVMDRALGANARAESKSLLAKVSAAVPAQQQGGPMPNEMRVANRIFADGRTHFESAFLDVTKSDWHAPAEAVDFRSNPEAGRTRINGWVATETRDKIKDLLTPGTIDQETRMVLVNAVYMKAQWLTPFTEGATQPAPFWTTGTTSKHVPMMHGRVQGTIGEHAGAHVVRLPYAGNGGLTLSMIVVVPDAKDGIGAVEGAYAKEGLAPFIQALTQGGKIDVSLPKYKVTGAFELHEALRAMGMERAFTDDADFSRMSKSTPLKISKVVHQAYADVDEKGTEAAAATAVVMTTKSSVQIEKPLSITVDRPFLFFVREESTGAVMFAGRIADPS